MCPVYHDALWGEISLSEPVLAELVQSAPVQRLKGIHQAGASFYLFPDKRPNTRFEHSIGVMHVLATLGAGLEERVAGLLHDVPHTAFSHTADIVFPNDEHNFHERFQHAIISDSSIPAILSKHRVDLKAALEPDSYPLLEQPLPDLCADRIDYALRDMFATGKIMPEEAGRFMGRLVPAERGVWVDDADAALWFALLFSEANDTHWTGPQEAGAYWALAGAIKRSYDIGAFNDEDLFSTDDAAMAKLRASGDAVIDAYLRLLTPGTTFYEVNGAGPSITTRMKQRAVDPLVIESGWDGPRRLSAISDEYAKLMASTGAVRNNYYKLWSDSIEPVLAKTLEG